MLKMEKENYQDYFTTLDKLIELLTKMKIRQTQDHHESVIGVSIFGGKKSKEYSKEYYNILSGNPDKDPDFDLMKSHLQALKKLLSERAGAELNTDSSPIITDLADQEPEGERPRLNHVMDGDALQSAEEEVVYSHPLPIGPNKSSQVEKSDDFSSLPVKDRSALQYTKDVPTDELSSDMKVYIDKLFNAYDEEIGEKIDEKLKEFKKNIDSILHDYVTKDSLCQEVRLIKQEEGKIRAEMAEKLSDFSSQLKVESKRIEPTHILSYQKTAPNTGVADLLSKSDIRSSAPSDTMREQKSSINNETRMAMHELANEYNSAYKNTTDGKHLNLKMEYARAWASGGKSFQSEEEAKKLPLVEFQGNYTYLAVEAEGDKYYLMPRKGMKLTPGLIQHAAYDQFFAYNLPEGNRELKIHLDEPAIVERRGEEYYLVRRGRISF